MEKTVQKPISDRSSSGYSVRRTWNQFRKNPLAMVCLVVFLVILLACLLAPVLCRYGYDDIDYTIINEVPSKSHIFGTDVLGRDLFARVLYGGRYTFRIAFTAMVLSTLAGGTVGLLSGFYGGTFDSLVMRLMDSIASVPTVLLSIVVEFALGFGVGNYQYAMAIALMPPFARLVRTTVMTIAGAEYIEAARALGIRDWQIILRHVLPNAAGPILIHLSTTAAEALLMCTVLGYIGLGISPPRPEWGALVATGYTAIRSHPHVALIPCFVVTACVLSMNQIGNGLRDALDGSRP